MIIINYFETNKIGLTKTIDNISISHKIIIIYYVLCA